jgi:hypothetical protein
MNKWDVVVYHKGKRLVKSVPDAKRGLALEAAFKNKGYAAHLVSRTKAFAPKTEEGPEGSLWCPYCRRWREFRVPRGDEDAPVGSYAWQNSVLARLEIAMCPWCGVTVEEFHVKYHNNLWFAERRTRSKKKGRRHRVGRR